MSAGKLTREEGRRRGIEDRLARHECDPLRWIKAWAPDRHKFEEGYHAGYYSDDDLAADAVRDEEAQP